MSFYIAIILFITSVISGLVLMVLNKSLARDRFFLLASFHLIIFLGYLASLILKKSGDTVVVNYFFLSFICSGIVLSGICWRSKIPSLLKYYFAVFALTIAMFILSPSRTANFLLTSRYTESTGPSFDLGQRYFLEFQGTVMSGDTIPHYKLIRKKGMFHETIQRDLIFNGHLDSVHIVEVESESTMRLRGFTSISNFVSEQIDSVDLIVPLKKQERNSIEYKL